MSEFEIYQQRMIEHEVAAVGAHAFRARENFSILIHGENRIAHNLLAILLGSGLRHVQIIASNKLLPAHIDHADFNALSVTNEHLGERRSATHVRIARSASIFTRTELGVGELTSPSELHRIYDPDLIISTSKAQGDYRQRWMSESSTHMYIDCDEQDEAWIGPLVIPGRYPCLTCFELHERDRSGGEAISPSLLGDRKETTVAAAALVAATVAIEVSSFVASGESTLIASRHPINLRAPIAPFHRSLPHYQAARGSLWWQEESSEAVRESHSARFFDFHPECGCVGDQLSF